MFIIIRVNLSLLCIVSIINSTACNQCNIMYHNDQCIFIYAILSLFPRCDDMLGSSPASGGARSRGSIVTNQLFQASCSAIKVPKNGWFVRENPMKMDGLGVRRFFLGETFVHERPMKDLLWMEEILHQWVTLFGNSETLGLSWDCKGINNLQTGTGFLPDPRNSSHKPSATLDADDIMNVINCIF